jgi:hypothetical protein
MTTKSQPHAAGEAAHTPTPWRAIILSRQIEHEKPNQYAYPIKPVGGNFLIANVTLAYPCKDGDYSKLDYAQGEANAAFIVRACNDHARLTAENARLRASHAALVEQNKTLRHATIEARPYVKGSADANTVPGWVNHAGRVLSMIDNCLSKNPHP